MSVALLDVNVLIALAWPSHLDHAPAHTWFASESAGGWATCPLTECGFVRVSSNPCIIPEAVTAAEAIGLLRRMSALSGHRFWPDDQPLTSENIPSGLLLGHRQVTDAYLLGLAIANGGRLVTFDRAIAALLPDGSPHLGALQILS